MFGRALALLLLAIMAGCVHAPAAVRAEFQNVDGDDNHFSEKVAQDDPQD